MHARLIAVVVLLLCHTLIAEEPPRTPAALHAMSVEAFFALPETRQPLEGNTINLALLDAAVFHATNQVRVEHELPVFTYDDRLARAAELHVRAMIEGNFLAHENPHDETMRLPMQRVVSTGYTPQAVSENLAQVFRVRYESGRPYYRHERDGKIVYSYDPAPGGGGEPIPPHTYASMARELLREWMNSPGHRENVLRPTSRQLGAAVRFRLRDDNLDEAISVQVFATPR